VQLPIGLVLFHRQPSQGKQMPKKLDEIKNALVRKGYSTDKAFAIATSKYKQMKSKSKESNKRPKSIDDLRAMAESNSRS
jgi:uncharacterized protein YdaT